MKSLKKTAAQTAVLMVMFNLGCKLLGFVREMAMAGYYGAGYVVDSFVMAQSIPNILLGGILVAISTAYMPLYSKRVEKEGEEAGNRYTSQVIFVLVTLSLITAIIGAVFAEPIVKVMATGFDEKARSLTSYYLRITFAYTVFSSIVGVFASFLQYKGSFILQILGDYLQNIAIIVMIVVSAHTNDKWLAMGLFLGYAIRCSFLYYLSHKQGYRFKMQFSGLKRTMQEILELSIPVFLGTTMQEINTFVDRTLASGLKSGSISALNYANQINTIVISLSITILTTIIYPKLVRISTEDNHDSFSAYIQRGFNLVMLIAIPVSIGSIVYSNGIIKLIYERGAFDTAATSMTAAAYAFYSLGIVFVSLNNYMTKIYYSLQEMRQPMICAGIGMGINIVLNIILVRIIQQNGLALATSIAAMVNAVLMVIIFKKKHKEIKLVESRTKIFVIGLASVVSIAFSYMCYLMLNKSDIGGSLNMLIAMGVAVVAYFIILKMFKVEELNYLLQSLFRRQVKE